MDNNNNFMNISLDRVNVRTNMSVCHSNKMINANYYVLQHIVYLCVCRHEPDSSLDVGM